MKNRIPVLYLLWGCIGAHCLGLTYISRATAADKSWQATARNAGLGEDDINRLHANRMLISSQALPQMFLAYEGGMRRRGSKVPQLLKFITSDAILNGYHVLYEESIRCLEIRRANRFPLVLRGILQNLNVADQYVTGQPDLVERAKSRARLIVGVALRLMDDGFTFDNEPLNALVLAETKKVIQATAFERPQWLDQSDDAFLRLDYSRYKPRGFYTSLPCLERYFRSMAWLQSIGFRMNNDKELLAILMIAHSIHGTRFADRDWHTACQAYFRGYREFVGVNDNWDTVTLAPYVRDSLVMSLDGGDLTHKRKTIVDVMKGLDERPLINDQIAFQTEDKASLARTNVRIISPYRTPSAVLFQRTTTNPTFTRPFPEGLEVCVALGSSLARDMIDYKNKDRLLAAIDEARPLFQGDSLYLEYLEALKALLDEPESKAPDFMHNRSWQTKSCNTVLGGVTQLRHTWILHVKQSVFTTGLTQMPPGFVEPNPTFFARMGRLAVRTRGLLEAEDAFAPDYTFLVTKLEKYRECLKGLKTGREMRDRFHQVFGIRQAGTELWNFKDCFSRYLSVKTSSQQNVEMYYEELRQQIQLLINSIRKGNFKPTDEFLGMINDNFKFDLASLWIQFAEMCFELETISRKQLNGEELDAKDKEVIENFGSAIARFTLYETMHFPRDDAPRIVDVFFNPQRAATFHMATGRPRLFYVLYPWEDQCVLCKGAVLPYYEHLSSKRLTNADWLETLDSTDRPIIPHWVKPLYSENPPPK